MSRRPIPHALIELAGPLVFSEILQNRKLRTPLLPPFFSRSQQVSADAVVLVPVAYGNFYDMTVRDPAMHRVQRLIESHVYKSDDFSSEFRDQGNSIYGTGRLLPPL